MGKSELQAKYAELNGLKWCSGPWCKEEERHATAFARMIERLTEQKWTPPVDNPSEADPPILDFDHAFKHIDSRMSTEWVASSTYAMLAAHARSGSHLKAFLENVMNDEVKHLAILSSADQHLRGRSPWRRVARMFKAIASLGTYHAGTRSTTSTSFKNPVGVFEVLYTFALTEYYTRQWLKTLPPATLHFIFETESNLPDLPEAEADDSDQSITAIKALRQKYRVESAAWREARQGWQPKNKAEVIQLYEFHDAHQNEIESAVRHFNGFSGAEDPTSEVSQTFRKRIAAIPRWNGVEKKDLSLFRECVFFRLRDYQIRNNGYLRARALAGTASAQEND
jgi:hypothetical protein